jgi:biotin carboxyl carrier protein
MGGRVPAGVERMKYHVLVDGEHYEVDVQVDGGGVRTSIGDEQRHVDVATLVDGRGYSLVMNGRSVDVGVDESGDRLDLLIGGSRYTTEVLGEREYLARSIREETETGDSSVRAVMTGMLREIRVKPGDQVTAGQVLFILEAMKMENEVKADVEGVVGAIHGEPGSTVEQGDVIVEIEVPDQIPDQVRETGDASAG